MNLKPLLISFVVASPLIVFGCTSVEEWNHKNADTSSLSDDETSSVPMSRRWDRGFPANETIVKPLDHPLDQQDEKGKSAAAGETATVTTVHRSGPRLSKAASGEAPKTVTPPPAPKTVTPPKTTTPAKTTKT